MFPCYNMCGVTKKWGGYRGAMKIFLYLQDGKTMMVSCDMFFAHVDRKRSVEIDGEVFYLYAVDTGEQTFENILSFEVL